MHLRLPPNELGRDFLLGDLHGQTELLQASLTARGFDPSRDRVISVGDLVDRGPDSIGALRLIEEPWFFAVRGNHEVMMLDALATPENETNQTFWKMNGGGWTDSLDANTMAVVIKLATDLPLAITLDLPGGGVIGICHGEWPGQDWRMVDTAITDTAIRQTMVWGRQQIKERRVRSDHTAKLTVHGHTPIDAPTRLGSAFFIDTGAVYGGALTLLTAREALSWPQALVS